MNIKKTYSYLSDDLVRVKIHEKNIRKTDFSILMYVQVGPRIESGSV